MENKKSKDEEFFDNCPICRLMKVAKEQGREPTQEELKRYSGIKNSELRGGVSKD